MNMEKSLTIKILIVLFYINIMTVLTMGFLEYVHITVPRAVENGTNAILTCEFDLNGNALYSLKWYKGGREFFRYTPKEIPAIKIFPTSGINIDRTLTNYTQLVLTKVSPKITGKYSCEVSADAPSFHTVIQTSEMEVVVLPVTDPFISGIKSHYQLGEVLQGNCSLNGSIPAAKLEWNINHDDGLHSTNIKYYEKIRDSVTALETRTIGINLIISHVHFAKGKLMLQCIAKVYDLYYGECTQFIEEDRPQVYSPSLSYLSDEEYNQRNFSSELYSQTASIINIILNLIVMLFIKIYVL